MTWTTSGARSTATQLKTRPVTTSRPARAGAEPPGRWWGPGAKALGLEHGQIVEHKPYDLLFGERKAPDGTPLGRPPGSGQNAAGIYTRLLAAEPHATADRKHQLRTEATRQARQSPLYFDLTLSPSKSISIFHASLGENARLAREAGDQAGDACWSGLVTEVDDMIWHATWAGFDYFQREACYTRTGSHHVRANGRETGQWHEADLAVAHWLQHTSRDGDMQLHVHSQIAHTARTQIDGKWRAPDSLGYNEHIGAIGAIVAQHLEGALTRRFGLQWVARDDGHGYEIKGISREMMRLFSSRRESITADLRERAAQFLQRYSHAPSQRELAQLAQASNFVTRKQAQADADHLAILHAIWTAETTPAREQRYKDMLMAALPPGYRQEPGHRAKWLWRTLRAAELAGLDAGQAFAAAIGERDLTGARDVPAVIDARLRRRTDTLVPRTGGPWSAQLPDIADPDRRAYAAQIAAAMDARTDRIGEHAVEHVAPWAVNALDPVPEHPVDRLEWQQRATSIGAYRELSGYAHPADPIGPEPATAVPDLRAAWHEALAALGPVDGPDVRGLPDGTLLHLHDTYPIETAWAPQWTGEELRQVRLGAAEARLAAVRALAEADSANRQSEHERAGQQQALAASYPAMHDAYREREVVFAADMADRQQVLAWGPTARSAKTGSEEGPLRQSMQRPCTDALKRRAYSSTKVQG